MHITTSTSDYAGTGLGMIVLCIAVLAVALYFIQRQLDKTPHRD